MDVPGPKCNGCSGTLSVSTATIQRVLRLHASTTQENVA